ncbi:MAG: amino acid permease [Oligoflexales bacterium]|nr:amino acid permease [Oligoflexales bacterium]
MNIQEFFLKKSVKDILAGKKENDLSRNLGPVNLITLGIGAIVGAGIFVLTGTVTAQYAGPAIILSFVIGAIACGFAGLCYAEFASLFPVAGSAYTYAYSTLGEIVAWVIGWALVLEYSLMASTNAVGWSAYMISFLKNLGINIPPEYTNAYGSVIQLADGSTVTGVFNIPAALIILLISTILISGVKESAKFNNVIVAIKLVVLLLFVAIGLTHFDSSNMVPFIPENTGKYGEFGWSGIVRGAGIIFFAYIGFDSVSTAAQEARNPKRDMPIGILGSLAICTVIYIVVSITVSGMISYKKLNVADPIAVAVDVLQMPWLSLAIKIGALAGLTSVMFVSLFGQSRIFYMMAGDGLLPKAFMKVHPKFRTPYMATILQGLVISVISGLLPIAMLGELVSMGTLFAFAVVSGGVIYLRKTQPDLERPFKVPGMPWTPIASILTCFYLMTSLPHKTWMRFGIWIAVGGFIYAIYGARNSVVRLRALRETEGGIDSKDKAEKSDSVVWSPQPDL